VNGCTQPLSLRVTSVPNVAVPAGAVGGGAGVLVVSGGGWVGGGGVVPPVPPFTLNDTRNAKRPAAKAAKQESTLLELLVQQGQGGTSEVYRLFLCQ